MVFRVHSYVRQRGGPRDIQSQSRFWRSALDNPGRDLYDAIIMSREIGCTIKRCSSESRSMFFWYYFEVDRPALA